MPSVLYRHTAVRLYTVVRFHTAGRFHNIIRAFTFSEKSTWIFCFYRNGEIRHNCFSIIVA